VVSPDGGIAMSFELSVLISITNFPQLRFLATDCYLMYGYGFSTDGLSPRFSVQGSFSKADERVVPTSATDRQTELSRLLGFFPEVPLEKVCSRITLAGIDRE
jgi:hypothetical protein